VEKSFGPPYVRGELILERGLIIEMGLILEKIR